MYLKLTGGRGIIVALGVLLVLAWKELLALVLVGLAGYAIFRNTALWVAIALVLLPAWSIVFREPLHVTVLCTSLVAIAAIKRLTSNHGTTITGTSWRNTYLHRLLYDRDVSSRDEWVYRTPAETQKDD